MSCWVFTSEKISGDFSFSQYNIKSAAGISHMPAMRRNSDLLASLMGSVNTMNF